MPLNHSLSLSKEIGLLFDQCLEIIQTGLYQTLCLFLINVPNTCSLMKNLHSRGHGSLKIIHTIQVSEHVISPSPSLNWQQTLFSA